MYLVILGRQPAIGCAELEAVYGSDAVSRVGEELAMVEAESFDVERFGGVKKAGRVLEEFRVGGRERDERKVLDLVMSHVAEVDGKVTLGLSSYSRSWRAKDLQKIGLRVKTQMKKRGGSLRLVPNDTDALSTATSHHNKLGLSRNKVEVMLAEADGRMIMAASVGTQNISAYAARDQKRPARDMFVGMLPPKLAKVIVNLAVGESDAQVVLDPFCGTGVLLQEALLLGYDVLGTDLAEKMVDYSRRNLEWLSEVKRREFKYELSVGDAMRADWRGFDVVACEAYLGQPFSAPPSPQKLAEVSRNCRHVIGSFLKNLARQTEPGTRVCVAVPVWRRVDGSMSGLNLLDSVEKLGYNAVKFKNATQPELIYYREGQVVGRELLVLVRR